MIKQLSVFTSEVTRVARDLYLAERQKGNSYMACT